MPNPGMGRDTYIARKNLARNLTAVQLSNFLSNRPTAQDLVKHKVMRDTMTWSREITSGSIPMPRNCHTCTPVKDRLYLLGGYGNHHTSKSSELAVLDVENMEWSRPLVAGLIPCERYSHTCVALGSSLFLFGGFSVDGAWMNDLHVLDTDFQQPFVPSVDIRRYLAGGDSLTGATHTMLMWLQPETTGTPPCARAACSAVVRGSKIYYFGGNDDARFYSDLHVLDTETMHWSQPETTD
eukprot:234564_1